ncbi:MAG: winged helix DNA-binding domain-containing protein [Candidatus Hermodarchaeota archaeon]
MKTLTLNAANQHILKKHHLTDDTKIIDILQIADDLCGLHATGTIEPYLTLYARTSNFKKEDLDKQLYVEKSLGRIRGMRKTLFIETKQMIPIVHTSIKSQTDKRDEQYLEMREISLDEYNVLSQKILKLVSNKEMSTTEIKKALISKKDIVAVISVMLDQMLLIRGRPIKSWKDRRLLYAPFEAYFPDVDVNKYTQEEAFQLLVHKYIKSYGPVTIKDIAWWLGFNKTQAKKVLEYLENQIEYIKITNLESEYIIIKEDLAQINEIASQKKETLNLLPRLDPYLMGYKDRERYVNLDNFEYVFDRSGNATSTILLNGKVIGVWDVEENPHPQFKLLVFEKVEENLLKKINTIGKNMGRFITEQEVEIKMCKSMPPLTKRAMGGFMKPLKECN